MNRWHRSLFAALLTLSVGLVATASQVPGQDAQAQTSPGRLTTDVFRFAILPSGAPGHPEGMTNDVYGNIYAASFELGFVPPLGTPAQLAPFIPGPRPTGPNPNPSLPFAFNYIYQFDRSTGALKTSTPLPAGVAPLAMHAMGNNLFVADVFTGRVLRYTLPISNTSVPAQEFQVCGGFFIAFGAPDPTKFGFCALNDMTHGPDGALYISDNAAGDFGFTNGRIFRLDPQSGISTVFLDPPTAELDVAGFPAFGVNGIQFNAAGDTLFMANMSTDRIFKITVAPAAPGVPSLANPMVASLPSLAQFVAHPSIDGPDDIVFDNQGRLWIASGQKHQVVAVNPQGQVVAIRGSYTGIGADGAPNRLLQPSSVVFTNGRIIVGNESNQGLTDPGQPIPWGFLSRFTLAGFYP